MADALVTAIASSPFANLPEPSRRSLFHIAPPAPFSRRERITQQGAPSPPFALIQHGRVKLERARAGHTFSIGHRGPGDPIGETGILSGGPATESAIVLDETRAILLPMQPFRK